LWHYSPAIRAEEADLDKRCHQSVPPDRSNLVPDEPAEYSGGSNFTDVVFVTDVCIQTTQRTIKHW